MSLPSPPQRSILKAKMEKYSKERSMNPYAFGAITLAVLIVIGVLCTSSAKGAALAARPPVYETEASDDTEAETQDPDHTDKGEESGISTVETSERPPDETADTVAPIEDPDKEEYKEYTKVEFPGQTYVGSHNTNDVSITITKVNEGELVYFICDIVLSKPELLQTAFANGVITGRAYTSKIASANKAVFAVNGDFCGFRTDGIIIREGKLYRNKSSDWDLCYVNKYGDLKVGLNNWYGGKELVNGGAIQSWCFGPTLVKDYKALTNEEMNRPGLSSRAREPRTAIGQVGDLHYIILVVDAVRTGTETLGGMTFEELAEKMEQLGCKTAYNLDGGGSTTLYFKGEVINSPCVNGERSVSDIIYIK